MRSLFRSDRQPGAGGPSRVLFRLAQYVPFVIILLGLGVELSAAHWVYTGPLLTAMPALASLTMGPKGTLSAAAGALAVSVTTATLHDAWDGQQIYSNLLGLLVVSVASVTTSNAVRTQRQRELNQLRRIATTAQEVLLRPVPARLGPLQAASMYLAAEAGAQIGGDLYEAVQTRYGIRVIMGDVRGKGLPAVRSAAVVLGAFREAAHYEDELLGVIDHCAAALRRESTMPGTGTDTDTDNDTNWEDVAESFVTVLVAEVPDAPQVLLVNRGHPPPMLLRQGKAQALVPTTTLPPLGLEDFITGPPAKAESYPFAPGDRLLLHTDGVIEARNPANDFFDLAETMEAVRPSPPSEFLEQLHQELIHHTNGRLVDDVAMLILDRLDDEAAGPSSDAASAP
ncbi:PP2C family protein-serine/threonine phosphatase [Streptomyces sp. NPDC051776]|uniref:PP2C family protein-serine/threonine phosphatase n=1 Tax=Streptomyces sp. NPDC051776 TaxID=3155414 RepID=UPI0034167EF5